MATVALKAKKVLKKAKMGKSLSVQRLGTVKIFSARRKRDCRTETADPLRKVMKKKVVKPKIEKAAAMQIVSNIKSDLGYFRNLAVLSQQQELKES